MVRSMELSEQAIWEFQQLYQREYGQTIGRERAMEYGTKLIDLVKLAYGKGIPQSLDAIKVRRYDKHGDNLAA